MCTCARPYGRAGGAALVGGVLHGATDADTPKQYMRRVAGGGSTTSRWLSNERCLPFCEKAARALHYSTWRIWGESLPPPAQVHGDQPCAGNSGGCSAEKG
jgi:hypothetical protein